MSENNISILGAGLNGMIASLALARYSVSSTIFEKTNLQFESDQRNLALTIKSKAFLEKIGLWSTIEEFISPINDIYVLDNKSPQLLHLSDKKTSEGALGYMIESHNLRKIVSDAVNNEPLISLQINSDYQLVESAEHHNIFDISGQKIKSSLTLVCDGRNSEIRKKYFKDRLYKSYDQSALIMNVEHSKPHEGTAVEHFMPGGVFAILPLCGQYRSSIVWAEPTELAKIYLDMNGDELLYYLSERFGEFLGEIKITTKVQSYPLTARITKNYYHNRLVVFGDSAHTIHPLAGQGLNQGIKDIDVISEIIARNISVALPIDAVALEEYENRRKFNNYSMYMITDNLNRLFCNNIPILSSLRKIGLGVINNSSILKTLMLRHSAS